MAGKVERGQIRPPAIAIKFGRAAGLPSNKFAAKESTKSAFADWILESAQADLVLSPAANLFDGNPAARLHGRNSPHGAPRHRFALLAGAHLSRQAG